MGTTSDRAYADTGAIDVHAARTREGLLLNLQAAAQIDANRQLAERRRRVTLADTADIRVREGYDYTPGVGWHLPAEPNRRGDPKPPVYHGARCACCKRPAPPKHKSLVAAVFASANGRSGTTSITASGRVVRGRNVVLEQRHAADRLNAVIAKEIEADIERELGDEVSP